jgi:hypothetical protein
MSSSSESPTKDPLQNLLEDTETELRRRLEEACEAEAKGVSTESTEEIRRLEDTLLAAAAAANQTIRVRRHMRGRRPSERERPIRIDEAADRAVRAETPEARKPGESGPADQTRKPDMGVREFIDDKGRPWRAWPVIPGQTRASASGRQFLGDFQDGWICFEGLGSSARRRLPYHRQSNWGSVTDRDLQRLLDQAIDAPVRGKKPQD